MNHDNLLVFGRRIHNGFRVLVNNGGDGSNNWKNNEREIEHNLSGIYLVGALAHLEGKLEN